MSTEGAEDVPNEQGEAERAPSSSVEKQEGGRRSTSRDRDRKKRSRSRDRKKRSRSRDRNRRSRSGSRGRRDSGRSRRRSRSRSRERRRSPSKSPEKEKPEDDSDSSSDSVISSWTRRYGPSKNDPPMKLKGQTLLELIKDAKVQHIRGKYGAWHDYLQYLHRHGKGARPPPGNDPNVHTKKTQITFLKSLRRCDRKGDVRIVLEIEKNFLSEERRKIASNITMPNSFINLPSAIPASAIHSVDPRTGAIIGMAPTRASAGLAGFAPSPVSAQQSQRELAAKFGLNESALEALKDPAVRAALDPAVLAQLAPVLATLQ